MDGQRSIARHYDALIDENNDPFRDPQPLRGYMDRWDGQPFFDYLELRSDQTVLEIGVGTGRLGVRAASLCREFTGIDLSEKTIERAKENFAGRNNVSLICGDFLSYRFDQKYDVIYSSLTFMHIRRKREAMEKVACLLNSGGRFILSADKNQDRLLDVGFSKIRVYPDRPETVRENLDRAGLRLVGCRETEFAWLFAAEKRETEAIERISGALYARG